MGRKVLSLGCLLAMGIGLCPGQVRAADSNWIASAGDWSDANNWSGGEPNALTYAYIGNGGTATITLGGEASGALFLGNAIGETGAVSLVSGSLDSNLLYVGGAGTGTFIQTDGNNRVSSALYLGYSPGSSGTYLLSGPGNLSATFPRSAECVGYSGTGTFVQSDGNNSVANGLYLAYAPGSSGTYELSGKGRLFIEASEPNVYVGYAGTGVFVQTGGRTTGGVIFPSPDPSVTLGYQPGASGTYLLSSSGLLSTMRTYVGYSGDGNFTLSDANHRATYLYLGYSAGSSGKYQMVGRGYLWSSACHVGYYGTGVFTQSDGNHSVGFGLFLGTYAGSWGTYILSGNSLLQATGPGFDMPSY